MAAAAAEETIDVQKSSVTRRRCFLFAVSSDAAAAEMEGKEKWRSTRRRVRRRGLIHIDCRKYGSRICVNSKWLLLRVSEIANVQEIPLDIAMQWHTGYVPRKLRISRGINCSSPGKTKDSVTCARSGTGASASSFLIEKSADVERNVTFR